MWILFGLVLMTVVVVSRVVKDESEDYRCNGHYIWDKPNNNGRTDRDPHHAEGNAYRLDKHTHY